MWSCFSIFSLLSLCGQKYIRLLLWNTLFIAMVCSLIELSSLGCYSLEPPINLLISSVAICTSQRYAIF